MRAAALLPLLPLLMLLGCKTAAPVIAPASVPTGDGPKAVPVEAAPFDPGTRSMDSPAQALERIHRRFQAAEARYVQDLERWAKAAPEDRGPKPKRQAYLDQAMRAWAERRHQDARAGLERPFHASQPALDPATLDPVDRVYTLDPTDVDATRFDRAAAAFEPEATEHANLLRGLGALARGEPETAARQLDAALRADAEARVASVANAEPIPSAPVVALIAHAVAQLEPSDLTRELTNRYGLDGASPTGRIVVVTGTYVDPIRIRVFVEDETGGLSFTNLDAREELHGDFAGAVVFADEERGGAVLVRATSHVDPSRPLVGVVYVVTADGVGVHPYALTLGPAVVEAPI